MLLTVAQAASHLGLCTDAVYELVEKRQIRHLKIGPGQRIIRFRMADLEAYAESCIVEPRGSNATAGRLTTPHRDRLDLKAVIAKIKETT